MSQKPYGVDVFAPAKVNLALHVTGQRAVGYHLIDSLVAFADVGDRVRLQTAGPSEIVVTGPEADPGLSGLGNIMYDVAAAFWTPDIKLSMSLEKNLPLASGIGGGSADAAAVYRGFLYLRGRIERGQPLDPGLEDAAKLMGIGADIPMCVLSETARVRGIGEQIDPWPGLPEMPCVLVNPRVPVATPTVFKALKQKTNPALDPVPETPTFEEFVAWLKAQRNDLQGPAMSVVPVISDVIETLDASEGCALARMSGSGATCFGLYAHISAARLAAQSIQSAQPGWWVKASTLNGDDLAEPVF